MSDELSKAQRRAELWKRAHVRSGNAADDATAARLRVNEAADAQRARTRTGKPGAFNDPEEPASRPQEF